MILRRLTSNPPPPTPVPAPTVATSAPSTSTTAAVPPIASTTVVTFGTTTTCGSGSDPTPVQQQPDLAGIFSVVFNRSRSQLQSQQQQRHQVSPMANANPAANTLSLIMHPSHGHMHHHHHHGHHHDFGSSGRGSRWPSFSMSPSSRSFWTKYCLLCTLCGSAATILAGIFLIIAVLFRYYTTSIYYFETVPTYIPAILLSICGVSTIAFSCKRNRNIILLRITACWSLVSAALSSVITITTSLIHMNRLQTLKECVYNKNPPSCTCFGHSYGLESGIGGYYNTNDVNGLASSASYAGNGGGASEPLHFVFENTADCDVIHGALYSCLRAVFAISVVAVLLSIFLCMLLYQLIGHERKKAYWSRIRRINSDWSTDFLACLPRTLPRERSGLMPLILTPQTSLSLGTTGPLLHHLPNSWGPPPPYEASASATTAISNSHSQDDLLQPPVRRTTFNVAPFFQPKSYQSASGMASSSHRFPGIPQANIDSPSTPSSNSNLNAILTGSFPFSPTITSLSSLNSNTATNSAGLSNAPKNIITTIGATASSSSSFYHPNVQEDPNASSSSQAGGGDNTDEYDGRQFHLQQIKLDRRSNFVPQILLQRQMPMSLRESKISISSDSDNLFSLEEDLFKEPNRDRDLEAKINNQIMQLLLLEEKRDAAAAAAGSGATAKLAEMEDLTSSCSIVTLQNDDDEIEVEDNLEEQNSTINSSRTISSLPASPFLNNVKKYIRERANSLRMVGPSPLFARRGRKSSAHNYAALGTSAGSAGGSLRDRLNINPIPRTFHLNPNYLYNMRDEDSKIVNLDNSKDLENKNDQKSSIFSENVPQSETRGSNPTIATNVTKASLKSRSLPGTPLKKRNRDQV